MIISHYQKIPIPVFVFLNLDQTIKQRQKVVDLLTYRKDYSGLQSFFQSFWPEERHWSELSNCRKRLLIVETDAAFSPSARFNIIFKRSCKVFLIWNHAVRYFKNIIVLFCLSLTNNLELLCGKHKILCRRFSPITSRLKIINCISKKAYFQDEFWSFVFVSRDSRFIDCLSFFLWHAWKPTEDLLFDPQRTLWFA